MNQKFWNNKKVFITGHNGFKGSWLTLWLQMAGAKVTGYSIEPPSEPNLYSLAGLDKLTEYVQADVRDADRLIRIVEEVKPDVVFHLAAQPIVRLSYEDPLGTYATNVMGTANLLEAVRKSGSARSVICVTSDKCYENKGWDWGYRENEPMGGYDPYSSSKGCSELVAAAYRNSYFNPGEYDAHGVGLATVRAGNVIGGGDWAQDRLVTDVITAFLNKNKVNIRSPHAIRPWQHVLEPLRGYIELAEKLWESGDIYSGAWNFGPDMRDVRPVKEVVNIMAKLWGPGADWIIDHNQHPHEAAYLKVDSSKAHSKLNWYPKLDLENALRWVVEWYKMYSLSENMREVTIDQIQMYMDLSKSKVEVV